MKRFLWPIGPSNAASSWRRLSQATSNTLRDDSRAALKDADIIITSTDAPGYVIDAQMVYEAMNDRPDRPLYLIDIAVPGT